MSIPSISKTEQPITQNPVPKSSLLNLFPDTIAAHICSFAGPRDISTFTTVSKQDSERAIKSERLRLQGELNRFITQVTDILKIESVTKNLKSIELLSANQSPTLLSLKTAVFDIKHAILKVLENLTPEKRLLLRDLPTPTFCEDILRLASIRHKLDENLLSSHPSICVELIEAGDLLKATELAATFQKPNPEHSEFERIFKELLIKNGFPSVPESIPNEQALNNAIQKVSADQLQQGNFSKAIQALNMIPNKEKREERLRELCKTFVANHKLPWAIKTAKNIHNKISYAFLVREICTLLAAKGEVREATRLAHTLPKDSLDFHEQSNALSAISQTLAKKGHFQEALQIAKTITNANARSNALYSISKALTEAEQIFALTRRGDTHMDHISALDVAKDIPDVSRREDAYQNICRSLAGKKLFPKSIEVSNLIQTPNKKGFALQNISKEMALDGLVSSALQIAETIEQISIRNDTYLDICTSLVKARQFPKSIEIVERISDQQKKDQAWLNISREMLIVDPFSAAQIASRIQNSNSRIDTLERIYKIFVDGKSWDQAIAVANLIPEEHTRNDALAFISKLQKSK